MTDQATIESIQRSLLQRRGTTHRQSPEGERWLDCRCPLHDDSHRSASFSIDRGNFTCRVCSPGASLPISKVLSALALPEPSPPNGSHPSLTMRTPRVETGRWSYDYYFPNGELSHRHWRFQYADLNPKTGKPDKRYAFQAPDGQWHKPSPFWPLYADLGLPQGAHLIVTEGEPATDAINSREHTLSGVPVHAITAGSTADTVNAIEILAVRLDELKPSSLSLWPDADDEGVKAMQRLQQLLQQRHHPCALLRPEDFQLAGKDDAVEFLQRGGDLGLLLSSLHPPRSLIKPRDVADRLIVTAEGAIWPGTERVVRLDQAHCSALWQEVTGRMPPDRDAKELWNLLLSRRAHNPISVHWRVLAEPNRVTWRPAPTAECYQITAEGVQLVSDSPSGVLFAPGPPALPAEADPDGRQEHFQTLCQWFRLSELEQALILAWLVCAVLGRQTPILLMRGFSGTGKSTLAKFLLGIVEPTLREIDLEGQRQWTDHRQLLQTLRQVPALLIDNLTAISPGMEDVLSRLVTGYNASVMWKYSNEVEQVRMRRALIITTTNYEVYKGDLASRMIVCTPQLRGDSWVDDAYIDQQLMPLVPLIRGYVFRQAQQVLAAPSNLDGSFRVASVGQVLTALGYDAPTLARQESLQRAKILNQHDPWILAIVDIWDRENQGGEFLLSQTQIAEKMRELGVPFEALPVIGSPKFARWAEEKHMILKDHGFTLERYRDATTRGYWFRRAK